MNDFEYDIDISSSTFVGDGANQIGLNIDQTAAGTGTGDITLKLLVEECTFEGNTTGIEIEANVNPTSVVDKGDIRKCWFEDNTTGIMLTGNDDYSPIVDIYNNYFIPDTSGTGVKINSTDEIANLRVNNNTFDGTGFITDKGIWLVLSENVDHCAVDEDSLFSNLFIGLTTTIDNDDGAGTDPAFSYNGSDDFNDFGCTNVDSVEGTIGIYGAAGYEERLEWDSPLINAGNPGTAFDDVTEGNGATNSENDIGCTGGPDPGVLDREWYNIIDGDDLDGDLPRDEYLVISSPTIQSGDELVVDDGVIIYMDHITTFNVYGTLDAESDSDTIFFKNYDDHWMYIYVLNSVTQDGYALFKNVDISGGIDGIRASGGGNFFDVLLEDSYIHDISFKGMYATNNADVLITDTEISDCNSVGIYLSETQNSVITGGTISENGSSSPYSGVYLWDAYCDIDGADIEYNDSKGISCNNSNPDIDDSGEASNIRQNGADAEDDDGAEIYIAGASYPYIDAVNIYDTTSLGANHGIFIWKTSTCDATVDAKNCYWGPNIATDNDFYWDPADGVIDYSDSSTTPNNVDLYELARVLFREGEYEYAEILFWRNVKENPNSGRTSSSIKFIYNCNSIMNHDMGILRTQFQELMEDSSLTNSGLKWSAQKYSSWCLVDEGEYQAAILEFSKAKENTNDERRQIEAEIDMLSVSELLADGQIDCSTNENRIMELRQRWDELADGESDEQIRINQLPTQFALHNAYPNPFNSQTRIAYDIPEQTHVSIIVYDLSGREVVTLQDGMTQAGRHMTTWNATDVPSGVYLCRFQSNEYVNTIKLTMVR